MLIRFGVENYCSIRDYQEISFVASSLKDACEGLIKKDLPGLSGLSYLRALALFGPNAAGKSTLLRGLDTLRQIVLHSYGKGSQDELPYTPFALDAAWAHKPTAFLIEFEHEEVRYCYELSYNLRRVTEERLEAFPKGRPQLWFVRDEEGLRGSSRVSLPKTVKPLLNDNVPVLSFLANYSNMSAHKAVKPVYEWFSDHLVYLNRGPSGTDGFPFSGEILDGRIGSDRNRAFVRQMVRSADLGISDISIIKDRLSAEERAAIARASRVPPEEVPDTIKTVVFEHLGEGGDSAVIDLAHESDGTHRMFDLSGFMAVALERGATIAVDELDASLHPILLASLVESFQSSDSNPEGAQLLFSAHNTSLLNEGRLRRDQVWLAEKKSGATQIYPLTDYSPRKGEALEQGYLAGRYSAVPVVPRCFFCGAQEEES